MINIQEFVPSKTIVSAVNVRSKKRVSNVSELVAMIKENSQLQPVLIRMEDGVPAVIAGQRRRAALLQIEKENPNARLLGVVVDLDDKAALAASTSENLGQSAMSELDYWKAFTNLIKKGWTVEGVATLYSMRPIDVKQRLALGTLPATILNAYEKGDIDGAYLKILTTGSKAQLSEWVRMYKEGNYPFHGYAVREFLAGGGERIDTTNALFDADESKLAITADLFNDVSYFADSNAFWELQNTVIDEAIKTAESNGWIVKQVTSFYQYEWRVVSKKEGGQFIVVVSSDGAVEFKKGYLHASDIKKLKKSAEEKTGVIKPKEPKAEITQKMDEYLRGYRTVSARDAVRNDAALAQRVSLIMTLHDDGGFRSDDSDELARIDERLTDGALLNNALNIENDKFIDSQMKKCGLKRSEWRGWVGDFDVVFKKIMKLPIEDIHTIVAAVTMDRITPSSCIADALNSSNMCADMTQYWNAQADTAFFDHVSNKGLLLKIYADTVSQEKADALLDSKTKVAAIRDVLVEAAQAVDGWLPKYFVGKLYGKK